MTQHTTHNNGERLIELGWLVVNELAPPVRSAVDRVRERSLEYLRKEFPGFRWEMPIVQRPDPVLSGRVEPVRLLQDGIEVREANHWDFAFVLTSADLLSHYKAYAMAVPSRSLGVAALSLSRLKYEEPLDLAEDARAHGVELLVDRLYCLAMHLLGDLNGLPHSDERDDFMYMPDSIDDLDKMSGFSERYKGMLADELADVADLRLEEHTTSAHRGAFRFYLHAAWLNRSHIASSVGQAAPWSFPVRLSRLTTAALSTLLILLMTAEVWELGTSLSPVFVAVLSLITLTGASAFILMRQQLLLRPKFSRLTEQTVITNVSMVIIVVLGMATTYFMLFVLTLLAGTLMFSREIIANWAPAIDGPVHLTHYLLQAGFDASVGIIIGALGVSFEGQYYFRHIAYADEET